MKRVLTFVILLLSVIAVYAGDIKDAKEFVAFASALNRGADISAWQNDKGEVCLETSLNIWTFSVHILLKPGLENFEHSFGSV